MTTNCTVFRHCRMEVLGLAVLAGVFASGWRHAAAQTPVPPPNQVIQTGNIVNIVGGVKVSVEGVLSQQDDRGRAEVLEARRKALQSVPGDLNQPTKLRMISLAKLDEAIQKCAQTGRPLPDEVRYLAGLQRVQYVFVYPEQHDIVLAGPAEGWKLNELGNVVGNVSGHAVLQLDDLLVALRYADAARQGGMSVSINPTPEGMQRVNALLAQQGPVTGNIDRIAKGMEEASGQQNIVLQGVPGNSRFANVLVAADYRMKRLGMNLDPSPVKALPSYLTMANPGLHAVQTPRWWLAPKYDPLATDGAGLAWELRGQGVQCMAEEDLFADGQRKQTAKANPAAQKWADTMTSHYEELAAKDTIFGDLRNCMDLAVVGALILKENLLDKVDLHPQYLFNERQLPTAGYNPPKQVDSKVSFVKKGSNFVISVSGGVQLQPWEIIQKQATSSEVASTRSTALQQRNDRWWWN